LACGLCFLLAGCFSDPFVDACEQAVKETLRAPSTYHRINVTQKQVPIPLDAYLAANESSASVREFMSRLQKKATRWIAYLEYDASNAYGVAIREAKECSYETLAESPSDATKFTVKIDGKDLIEKQMDAVRRVVK